jgi:formylglycine-generating enzyme required for sulfatase activity
MFDLKYNGTRTITYKHNKPGSGLYQDDERYPPDNTVYIHTYTNAPVVTFLSVTQDDGARGDSSFTTQPVARTVSIGQPVTFSALAETFDGSAPAYQWLKDGVVIPGATTSTLVLPAVVASQIGDYSVRIQGEAGNVFSQTAGLRLTDAPSGPWRSLVACYPFDGSPVDVCRPTQPAELVNAVQLVTDPERGLVADIDGRGFGIPPFPWETPALQGPGGFIRIPRPVAAAGESFTISFWIKEKGYSSWHGEAFLTMGEGVDSMDLLGRYWVNSLGGATEFYGSQSSMVEGVWPARAVVDAAGVAVVTEPWTAWTLVAEGSDVKVYREGIYRGRVPYALGTKGDFVIGSHGWLDGVPRYSTRLRALIDDVRIFNRALTAPEILQLHATSQPVPGPDAFVSWTAEYGLDGNEAAFTADPDRDGLTNLQEYCFGTPPAAYTGTSSRFQTSSTGSTLDWWGRSDVEYEVQTSIDLVQWTTSSFPAAPAPEQAGVPAGYQRFQVELPVLDPSDRINLYAMRVQAVSSPFFSEAGTVNMTPPNGEPVLGGSVVLSAPLATGTALAYQWYKDGVPLAGAIQSRLEITRATTADTGHYELAVTNAAGTTRSRKVFLRPVTESIPEVSTGVATGVTATGAEVAAVVTGDGGAFVSERGVVYAMTPNPTVASTPTLTSSAKLAAGTGTGPFRVALTALASRSTYFLRAYAVNGHGTAYGEEVVLTTLASPVALATVNTGAVSDVTSTTLSVGGVVTDGGSSPVTVRGVVYGLTAEPTAVAGTAVAAGAGTGAFTVGLTGLQPVTPYYVRAFATNAVGTSYGATVSVMTLAVPVVLPQVTTSAVTDLTPLSATAGGEVVQDGGAVVTARGVVYGASPAPTLSTGTMVSAGGGTGTFSAALSGLTASSTYYLRAFATNSAGTAYGEEISFTTAAVSTGFAPVHADSFVQGSPESEAGRFTDEGPQFTATLTTGIHLKQTEITWNEWSTVRALAGAYGFTDMAAGRNGGDGDASGTHPVTMVSWWDVVKWCNLKSLIEGRRPAYYTAATLNAGAVFKVGTPEVFVDWSAPSYRLPTEAEWEFSCRAGTTGPVYGELSQIAWYAENSGDGTHPVGQLLPNNWGLQDMMGNVWEWCWDWKPVYDGSPQTDPRGAASGTDRVMRGGCFHNAASVCRSAYRNVGGFPGGRYPFIGFRPVLNVAPTLINPFIVAQPAARSLVEGQSLSLSVRAIGSPLTYQWFRNGVALNGATASSLNILAVEAGEGGAYTVVVSSQTGSTTSQPAAVVVAGAADSTHVRVSSGDFVLGSPAGEAGRLSEEGPTSEVTLTRSFRLKKTEVTWAEWSGVRELAAQYGYTDLGVGRNGSQGDGSGAHPVTEVSWWDAVKWCNLKSERSGLQPAYYTLAYLSTLPDLSVSTILRTGTPPVHVDWAASGYRLPTEVEWEYACRAGTTGAYAGPVNALAWYYDNSLRNTHGVGQLQANALGLHDMHGNVWEWCWDDFAAYTATPKSDPRTTVSDLQPRVVRGGSWGASASLCRSASRGYQYTDYSINDQGFRTLLPVATQAGVKTAEAAEITDTTALLGGTVTPSPIDTISAVGVVFAPTPNPTLATGTLLPSTTLLGSFSIVASGLLENTPYFARAFATTSSGTDYGAEITFKTSEVPAGFALIQAGPFQMGDTLDGISDAPVRQVTVSAFYMAQHETTKALWDEVRTWGMARGYTDLRGGEGKASNHPVTTVSWFDVIKWCNARSEKEGLTPCYTVGGSTIRTGQSEPEVSWTAKGYRLPTEAEWEKAARGGQSGQRFPWGDTITHSQANYNSYSSVAYDITPTRGPHPTYAVGGNNSSPVGSFAANGYGLYDVTGNVFEWCWDWYGSYGFDAQTDPKGAGKGLFRIGRIGRGGSWNFNAPYCRVSFRYENPPSGGHYHLGFRPARGL